MTTQDFVLIDRLERRVDAHSFATVLKAYLIVKTRIAARRADREFKEQRSGTLRFKKLNSRVALPEDRRAIDPQAVPCRRPSRIRRLWSFKQDQGEDGVRNTRANGRIAGEEAAEAAGRAAALRATGPYPKAVNATDAEMGLLEQRLSFLGCRTVTAVGDGNCQFRSCSFGLFGNEEHHKVVRQTAVAHMRSRREEYSVFFEGDTFEKYIREMSKSGTWGDELTLRAIADGFGCTIHLITSNESNWYLRYDPEQGGRQVHPKRHLFLSYISPIHYNAFYLKDEKNEEAARR